MRICNSLYVVRRLCTLALVAVLTLGNSALADDIDALMARLSNLNSLSTNFRQLTLDASETNIQTISGTLQLVRPAQLYWYSDVPYEQSIYVNEGTLWIFDMDLAQAIRQPVEEQWEQSPALVLTGTREQITERYAVEQIVNRPPFATFTLTPRGENNAIESLDLAFEGNTPTSIRLRDGFNQTTLVNFDNLTLNPELDPEIFVFNPPAGVDVIDQMGQ
ncbi:outer membrane lipoprotein chaperone LolA [Salinispirillum marinum]|uniref:Outer-membrane lipoprotein carrier protein n=2 Tax=Saccharospirillaceae TaxID=255527 RepID=A0ABV8BGT4_9GAMM